MATSASASHPVVALLAERRRRGTRPGEHGDGARLALVVEGGGMRGAVSGGMSLALDELGLVGCIDAAYGSSAGALGAAWLLCGEPRAGLDTYLDGPGVRRAIRRRRLLVGGRVIDMDRIVGEVYERLVPGFFGKVLASPVELHPIATDVATGGAVDLGPTIVDEPSLRRALLATSRLPIIAGPPVRVRGRRYLDAGLSAAIPFRAAVADGATHVLILRSRRSGDRAAPPSAADRRALVPILRRLGPAVADAYLSRAARERADEDLLERHARDPALRPYLLSVQTAADAATVSRLERDVGLIGRALDAGHAAALDALSPVANMDADRPPG